jgi:hypothetical protein
VIVLTVVVIVDLLVATGYWLRRVAAPTTASMSRSLVGARAMAPGTAGALSARAAPATAPQTGRPPTVLTRRADAVCHLAMSLGMAAMFLAAL